jgi:hypothetical protein
MFIVAKVPKNNAAGQFRHDVGAELHPLAQARARESLTHFCGKASCRNAIRPFSACLLRDKLVAEA